MAFRRLIGIATLVAIIGASSAAYAEPTATEKETARQLMTSGRAKRDRGDVKEAHEDFRRAHAIMKAPTTGLELGRTQIALGLLVEARDTLLEVSRMPEQPGNQTANRAREDAKSLADGVSPKIPTLRIELTGVTPQDGTEVTLDGTPIIPESMVALKVNPGKHEILARRGKLERREQVSIAEREEKAITIDLTGRAPEPKDEEPTSDGGGGGIHPLVWIGFGTAGAGVLVGSILGALSISKYGDVAPLCNEGQCPPETHDDLDDGVTFGTVSTVAFVVGGAGLAAGIIGLFLPWGDEPSAPEAARIEPWIAPGFIGVQGRF